MSNFFNDFVVGIDVSSKSSVITILMPGGEAYGKKINITNDLKGFDKLLLILTDITENFSKRPKIFMESTGLYHMPLLNYFNKNNFECYVINPIHTKNFAKQSIRKVKNDKVDSLRIAQLAQSPTFFSESFFDEDIFLLKKLCREYDSLVSHRAHYKKKVLSSLNLVFPKFNDIFSDTFSAVPLAILSNYPTYKDFLSAHKSDVVTLMKSTVSHSSEWADKKYKLIYTTAKEAEMLKLPTTCLGTELTCFINIIKTFSKSIDDLKEQILIFHKQIPNFEDNAKLLCTHPEVGLLSAISFLAEIGDIKNFSSPKKLVAFLGVDTSVSQSGAFTSTHNKLTKRGSNLARKILYNLAIASIKTLRNGASANPVLLTYYNKLIKSKPKKIAICAVMHKLINHFFAILRDKKAFELRLPETHKQIYIDKNLLVVI
ncbi:IS110 family transposase [Clostridium beijerinckii]|uniref:Transposase n=1 Tax=Clostridium beijerinckii TaxID=1520 RepID=A0AAX0B1S8_CLOBE|nr:IS110 family transposase [Clostridium beijerinckii]NRT87123.1 transposase [Clostridium beijerinckii]NRT88950.1 transposase [Clostridium beijerinckii]NRT89016.1 transposase [Clostridium beijerinckii]NYC72554.1 transposase [Clostridium beijerinckii]NYC74405.1 transposase [Clostridium beijerinckii]